MTIKTSGKINQYTKESFLREKKWNVTRDDISVRHTLSQNIPIMLLTHAKAQLANSKRTSHQNKHEADF